MSSTSRFSCIRTLFNIGKKFIDVLDDLWSAIRPYLPTDMIQSMTPFVMGGIGFITHLGEGIQAAQKAQRAYRNKAIGQRYTRLGSATLIMLFAAAGMGVALSLGAAILGAAVSGTLISTGPVIIPALLAVIYGLSLWRKFYIFRQAREKEAWCRRDYLNLYDNKHDTFGEQAERHKKRMRKRYEESRLYRLRAERKVAFNIVEVLASSMIVVSTILGTAAIVGASVGTFGALPMTLLVGGVILGAGCKLLDYFDKKYNFRMTLWLRSRFISQTEVEKKILPKPKKKVLHSNLHGKMLKENLIEMADLKGHCEESPQVTIIPPSPYSVSRPPSPPLSPMSVRMSPPASPMSLPESTASTPLPAKAPETPSKILPRFTFTEYNNPLSTNNGPANATRTKGKTAIKITGSSLESNHLYWSAPSHERSQSRDRQGPPVSRAYKNQVANQRPGRAS